MEEAHEARSDLHSRPRRPSRPAFARQPAAAPSSAALEEGRDLLEEQKFKEAIKAFKQAEKELGKPCVECQLGLAKAYNSLGAFRDALKSVEAVLAAPNGWCPSSSS